MIKKTNDQIILEQILKDKKSELGIAIKNSEFFELYSASEILKDYDVTYDDIEYGIVGNGGDGGIDSIFTFVNGELQKEDTQLNTQVRKNYIELVIVQSKTSPTFKEDAIIKFRETIQDLFDLDNHLNDFKKRYNSLLLEKVSIFRNAYSKLAKTFPTVLIKFFYVTQGVEAEIHQNVLDKSDKLRGDIHKLFSGSGFEFSFIGAANLLEMSRNIPASSRTLEISEQPISTSAGSYICLASLTKYYEFISDNGALARSIFESNVRDYQGSVTVNTGIRLTLQNINSDDFWYLNNGVTIITPKAVSAGKQLTIEDPQIVNGLQTSHEIYRHFSSAENAKDDKRSILIRIICEENEEARDRIIRATNSQTAILPASLRSSDEIHRNIEDYLKANDFYYDRKKNFYKNLGKPSSKIISIAYLAQAMMTVILFRPDSARARPSTLINSDVEYKKIFSLDISIDTYLKVILILKATEIFLKVGAEQYSLDPKTMTNIKYYVAMVAAIKYLNTKDDILLALSAANQITIDDAILNESLGIVLDHYNKLGGDDQVAKGPFLTPAILATL
ncbi:MULTISPECIES: AIPR family protein [Pseudomonas]|uniref:AIPR protein n=2 Tax=Pseudomonas TaxID=286 RepID=A0A2X2CYB2_PSELU|nr:MULTISPECIES: AIPR family protein [Pseudomonas]SER21371.1 AIPR protein [Pseudomonas lutea]SPZ04915.1 AIPR protein [Pseudomonas luteola]